MKKISQYVAESILSDEFALEAFRTGILNLSAYADIIQPIISEKSYKPVSKSAIVTALSRMKNQLSNVKPLRPKVKIKDLTVRTSLVEITFEKTAQITPLVAKKIPKLSIEDDFYTITYGIWEISIICPLKIKDQVLGQFVVKPKNVYEKLNAITVRFDESDYIKVPNIIYALVSAIASKRINIIDIVSTNTELSFILEEKDVKETIDSLKSFFRHD